LFWNKCFNHGIIGAYHITFVGTLFPGGGLALNIARVISPDLIPQCTTYRACIQILLLLAVEDAVIDACMYLLHL
jgi:hypothetical protein